GFNAEQKADAGAEHNIGMFFIKTVKSPNVSAPFPVACQTCFQTDTGVQQCIVAGFTNSRAASLVARTEGYIRAPAFVTEVIKRIQAILCALYFYSGVLHVGIITTAYQFQGPAIIKSMAEADMVMVRVVQLIAK